MNMMRALIPSTILTLILSAMVGFFGRPSAFLALQSGEFLGFVFFWSWTLFFAAMALNGCLALRLAGSEPAAAVDAQDKAKAA